MKLIHKFKSPNFNERKSNKINLIVIHYTALKSISESLSYLCSKKNKVSCHYLISKNGDVYNLVTEKNRAWHAGESYWKGEVDINSNSIGVELDYIPSEKNTKYTKELIDSLTQLLQNLCKKYKITPDRILGHSDIAPYRKIDPGSNFPWNFLEDKRLAFKLKKIRSEKNSKSLIKECYSKNKLYLKDQKILFMLDFIGYDISLASKYKINFNQLIQIYFDRFKYYDKFVLNKVNKVNKVNVINVLEDHFLNILLTKLKK